MSKTIARWSTPLFRSARFPLGEILENFHRDNIEQIRCKTIKWLINCDIYAFVLSSFPILYCMAELHLLESGF